ncbi:MAG: hypothetical protein P8M22_03185 [Phycisphaerales bacterium]|nr:hypothetical protein [Phycisphaerales bacterium]
MKTILLAVVLVATGMSTAWATTPAEWTLWVEGDPPNWNALDEWIVNGQDAKLPTGNLVIRLLDPMAPNDQGADYVLPDPPSGELCKSLLFIKNLRSANFDGQISVLPYYNHNTEGWLWPNNNGTVGLEQWFRPMQWSIQANEVLAAHGVSNGINAVNYENFDSHAFIQIDDADLLSWQNHLLTIWPQWDQDPKFIGLIASKDNNSIVNMIRYTTTTIGGPNLDHNYFQHPPLVGGMLECYQMYKICQDYSGGHHTVVDVTTGAHSPAWYPPYSGQQLYESSGNSADPAGTLLGTPTLDCPDPTLSPPQPSTLGFLIAVHASPCGGGIALPNCTTNADMSKLTMLFSNDNGTSSKIFGTWDGVMTPATVDTFKTFVGQFDDTFESYWQPDQMPQYGIWEFEQMPSSWKGTAASCPGDFTGDSLVDVSDILGLVDTFGTEAGDVNGDGDSDIEDLLNILHHYGRTCH